MRDVFNNGDGRIMMTVNEKLQRRWMMCDDCDDGLETHGSGEIRNMTNAK